MQKKATALFIIISMLLCSFLAGCGGSAGNSAGSNNSTVPSANSESNAAATDTITIRLAGTLPAEHQLSKTGQLFADEVNKKSGGALNVEFYPAGQLYNDETMVKAVPQGGVEMGICQTANWSGLCPATGYYTLSSYFDDYDWFKKCCAGEPGQIVVSELEAAANVKVLQLLNYGICELVSTKPLRTPADFKGARLRMLGTSESIYLQALGGSPVSMSAAENYEAMQKGTVEGASTGPSSVISRKLYEVGKYVTVGTQLKETKYFLMVNGKFWNSLSPEHQRILEDAGQVVFDYNVTASKESDQDALDQLEKLGCELTYWTPEEFKAIQAITLEPVLKQFRKEVGDSLYTKLIEASEALR